MGLKFIEVVEYSRGVVVDCVDIWFVLENEE